MEVKKPSLLHIYGQPEQSHSVHIVGNIEALESLRKGIDYLINNNYREDTIYLSGSMTTDGQEYNVVITKDESKWEQHRWSQLQLPYYERWALDKHGIHPHRMYCLGNTIIALAKEPPLCRKTSKTLYGLQNNWSLMKSFFAKFISWLRAIWKRDGWSH